VFLASLTKDMMIVNCKLENMGRGGAGFSWVTLPNISSNDMRKIPQKIIACWESHQQRTKYEEKKSLTTTLWFWRAIVRNLLRFAFVSGGTAWLHCFSLCVFYFHGYYPRSPFTLPPVGAAKGNSLLRKVMGALWRLDVLIFRYGAPS
jgi:hypothetical protein